jgi:SpoVK/Ycf46/Vps4 family AAA+-type ATPase
LKRLVTVLLQAIDDWPAEGLLIAATNHDDLLDPAVWRRFERTVRFPAASAEAAKVLLERHLGAEAVGTEPVLSAVSAALADRSFADIARVALHAKRNALLRGEALEVSLLEAAREVYSEMPPSVRIRMANALSKRGYSQRAVADVTGVSRDTIRKHSKSARARKG